VTGSSWSAEQEFGMPPHQQASQSKTKVSLGHLPCRYSQLQQFLKREKVSCLISKTYHNTRVGRGIGNRPCADTGEVDPSSATSAFFSPSSAPYRTLLTILRKETPDVHVDLCPGTNRPCASIRPTLLKRRICAFVQISYSCLTSPPGSVPISWQED